MDSIRQVYSKVLILVGDDGWESISLGKHRLDTNIKHIRLPFACGEGEARNQLLNYASTSLIVFLDDHVVINEYTDIGLFITILQNSDLDMLAFQTSFENSNQEFEGGLIETHGNTLQIKSGDYGWSYGCQVVDILPHSFIGKSLSLRRVLWDSRFKVAEQEDFFYRAKQVVQYVVEIKCLLIVC